MFRKNKKANGHYVEDGYFLIYRSHYEVGTLKQKVEMLKELGCVNFQIITDGSILCDIPRETIEKVWGNINPLIIELDSKGVNVTNDLICCPNIKYVEDEE